uniref:Uncharacterized protein LOC8264497 n=1 Tax=Rhizophora mucronata TaxID=61149 RepID=A0A2P2J5T3_RHIMU
MYASSSTNCRANNSKEKKEEEYIEHQVSKMDTLAGVAIKYGVEVADIKRLNGLPTDFQMFALKTLLIPSPSRHLPSAVLSNASSSSSRRNIISKTPPRPPHPNSLDPSESLRLKSSPQKVSSAMNTLQKYYGLMPSNNKGAAEGADMAVYRTGRSDSLTEGLLPKVSPSSGPPYHSYFKSRNLDNGFVSDTGAVAEYVPLAEAGDGEAEKSSEKSVRRRQKADSDSRSGRPESLFKEEANVGSSDVTPVTGKGLTVRPKSASRATLVTDSEPRWLNSFPVGLGESIISNGLAGVRKSSSTPSLQEQESTASSVWPTPKWNLKTDLQALSTAAITIPIFDGLSKPISSRRSKAALD